MWDDFYGIQGNPYGVADFKLILKGLKALPQDADVVSLINQTEKALKTEEGITE